MFNIFTTLSAVSLASVLLLGGCDRKPAPPPAPVIGNSTSLPAPALPPSAATSATQ